MLGLVWQVPDERERVNAVPRDQATVSRPRLDKPLSAVRRRVSATCPDRPAPGTFTRNGVGRTLDCAAPRRLRVRVPPDRSILPSPVPHANHRSLSQNEAHVKHRWADCGNRVETADGDYLACLCFMAYVVRNLDHRAKALTSGNAGRDDTRSIRAHATPNGPCVSIWVFSVVFDFG